MAHENQSESVSFPSIALEIKKIITLCNYFLIRDIKDFYLA